MEAVIDRDVIAMVTCHFKALAAVIPLRAIRSEQDYDEAVASLNQLLDAGAANEGHPLADLAHTLGALISEYDAVHYPAKNISPIEMVRFLMDQHGLSQSDLPEIGSQGVVSEILSGKRELNARQIRALGRTLRGARKRVSLIGRPQRIPRAVIQSAEAAQIQ